MDDRLLHSQKVPGNSMVVEGGIPAAALLNNKKRH